MNIVFHSTISKVGDKYFVKDVFAEYILNLSKKEKINFITPVLDKRAHFHTQELKIEDSKLSIKSIPSNYIKKLIFMFKYIKDDDLSLIFMPTFSGALASFMAILLRKKYALYFGTDWSKIREKRSILIHDRIMQKDRLLGYFDKILNSIVCNKAKLIFVTGGQLKREYLKFNLNVVETKPIINIKNFPLVDQSSIKMDIFNVLFVGKITKAKGVFDLIECVKLMDDSMNLRFTFVGDGDALNQIKTIVDKSKLNDKVELKGYVKNGTELFKEYYKANVFVLPSYFEGFPRVLYEAMQLGVAIITTPVNSIPYLLEDNKTALFIEVGNPISIKNAILKVYNEETINDKLVKNGRELIESILNESASEQHLKFLKSI